MMLEFVLPWPDKGLSPNVRAHWATRHRAVRKYRKACWGATLMALADARLSRLPQRLAADEAQLLHVELVFSPPTKRARDEDNLIARMKSGLDGIAEALGVNDKRFRLRPVTITDPRPRGGVQVRIRTDGGS
jgi:crossover junction endodeoxyribonuclease RusA